MEVIKLHTDAQYKKWIADLKAKIRSVQIKAALSVNKELLTFYWELGTDIVQKQTVALWGDGFLNQLSSDLMAEFPDIKGFSRRNLELIRQWYCFWTTDAPIAKQLVSQIESHINQQVASQSVPLPIDQQPVGQIIRIPWGHNIAIISKCKSKDKLVAEYALSDIHKPIGVSEYQLTQSLPENLKSSLPSIEEIEAELAGENV
jgi:Protein of unknown function (DUF1016).